MTNECDEICTRVLLDHCHVAQRAHHDCGVTALQMALGRTSTAARRALLTVRFGLVLFIVYLFIYFIVD